MIPAEIRADFPILSEICYLDSAATSLSPEPVLAAMLEFEHVFRANVGRGVHRLAQVASQKYWDAHQKARRFIGAEGGELVFTRNTTEAINMVAWGLPWQKGDRIVTTLLEHHSNLLPWMRLRDQKGNRPPAHRPGSGRCPGSGRLRESHHPGYTARRHHPCLQCPRERGACP